MKRVLFVCIENSNRSQMAEAFARMLGGADVEAESAGSRPSGRASADAGSPGSPTRMVPPPDAATGANRSPFATISLTGGVERKICWSNPTRMPPMVCPTDSPFFFRCSLTPRV